MKNYRKKPVVIQALTFDEMVKHGMEQEGANIVDGSPWNFSVSNHVITHETEERYLISTLEGTMDMTPKDMLIIGIEGEIYPCKVDIFHKTYEEVPSMTKD